MTGKIIFRLFVALLVFFVFGVSSIFASQEDSVKKYKAEFLLNYGFFITSDARVSYYKEILGKVDKENKIFKSLKTIEDVDKFIEVFWKVRDPNPSTPKNEFKDRIDQRIRDVKNEIFAADVDIPGTRFDRSGGLRGDLAHVYLLYGQPGYKDRLSGGFNYSELVVWYFFDIRGKHLFRFLFYENYGMVRVFKEYMPLLNQESLIDPAVSPLRKISNKGSPTPQELYDLLVELEREDPQGIFRAALFEFSYYHDITIYQALKAPEPAALTAERTKPVFSGQPEDLTLRKFLNGPHNSFIPADFVISKEGRPSFRLALGYSDIDWEIKGDEAVFVLDLRISFQNKTTKALNEYLVRISKAMPRQEVEKKRKGVMINGVWVPVTANIIIDGVQNFAKAEEPRSTLRQLVSGLEPGEYVVNIDLRDPVTEKSAGGWREEITIK